MAASWAGFLKALAIMFSNGWVLIAANATDDCAAMEKWEVMGNHLYNQSREFAYASSLWKRIGKTHDRGGCVKLKLFQLCFERVVSRMHADGRISGFSCIDSVAPQIHDQLDIAALLSKVGLV